MNFKGVPNRIVPSTVRTKNGFSFSRNEGPVWKGGVAAMVRLGAVDLGGLATGPSFLDFMIMIKRAHEKVIEVIGLVEQ